MSKEKFTQGEWLIDSIGIEGPLYPVLRFSILCIPVKGEKLNLSDDAMRSNAALIAAAPEMYRVLSGICGEKSARCCNYAPESCNVCSIRKALAKARGAE